MKRILMIAYHFPPLSGSSGIQRTLRFVQHLPSFGWEPLVLSAHPRAYERTSRDLLAEVPPSTVVRRAFAVDTARHLAVGGRYLASMAVPDRWVSWRFAAVREGMRMIREFRPQVLWSTYPIATAHMIGHELARRSGLPWVADFRDPMAEDGCPADPAIWNAYKRIEEGAMQLARLNVFTTPGAARFYSTRYPRAASRIDVIENGYDEETFARAEGALTTHEPLNPGTLTILHSGIVYPQERDPRSLLAAFGRLTASGEIPRGRLKLRFRDPVHVDLVAGLAQEHGIADLVEVLPPLPYSEALAEMLRADGLLILQAGICNDQIPAKLYEYLRARRPIVACVDPRGDTAAALSAFGVRLVAPIDDAVSIREMLLGFTTNLQRDAVAPDASIAAASRVGRTASLSSALDRLTT